MSSSEDKEIALTIFFRTFDERLSFIQKQFNDNNNEINAEKIATL